MNDVQSPLFQKEINRFAKVVIASARGRLTRSGHNVTSTLYKSLTYKVAFFKKSYSLDFFGADYFQFIDKGVKGKSSSAKAPRSPYSYKDKKPPIAAMRQWVQARRFQFKNKKGKFLTYEQTAYIVRNIVYETGIPATEFFTAAFRSNYPKHLKNIGKAFALDQEKAIASAFKEQTKKFTNGNNSN